MLIFVRSYSHLFYLCGVLMRRILVVLVFLISTQCWSQKVGYIASQVVRDRWQDMIQATQRIQSMVDDWKRELAQMQQQIDDLDIDIKKNRLIWSAEERSTKEVELQKKRAAREEFAHKKFDPNGEYETQTFTIMKPIEEKLYLATQDVAASEGYDIVLDKSTQPIPYANPKFDITVKVMKKLNIPAEDLEEKQKKAIEDDPKNKKDREQPQTPRKRSRTETESKDPKPTDTPAQEIPR